MKIALLILALPLLAAPAQAAQHTLWWDHQEPESVAGFRLAIWGTPSSEATRSDPPRFEIDLGVVLPTSPQPPLCGLPAVHPCSRLGRTHYALTNYEVGELPAYVRATAYDSQRVSMQSNEKDIEILDPPTMLGAILRFFAKLCCFA